MNSRILHPLQNSSVALASTFSFASWIYVSGEFGHARRANALLVYALFLVADLQVRSVVHSCYKCRLYQAFILDSFLKNRFHFLEFHLNN